MAGRFLRHTAAASLLLLAACSSDPPAANPTDAVTPSAPEAKTFVSVAVDNHFHDIHPTDRRKIGLDQTFVVKNQGRNLHNVTIVGTDISEDLQPGDSLAWSPVRETLRPGKYQLVCKYHDWEGMKGTFTVVEEA